jgi:type IV secretory pathway VirB6-like protein
VLKATRPLTKGRKAILAALTLLVIFGSVSLSGALSNLNISAAEIMPGTDPWVSDAQLKRDVDTAATAAGASTKSTATSSQQPLQMNVSTVKNADGTLAYKTVVDVWPDIPEGSTPQSLGSASLRFKASDSDTTGPLRPIDFKLIGGNHFQGTLDSDDNPIRGSYANTAWTREQKLDATLSYTLTTADARGNTTSTSVRDQKLTVTADDHQKLKEDGTTGDMVNDARKKAVEAAADHSQAQCEETLKSLGVLRKGICGFIVYMGDLFGKITNWAGKGLVDLIEKIPNYIQEALSGWTKDVWGTVRTLVDIIAVIALVIIGFANILHINLNVYAVKRTLPMVIGGLIFANLSFFLTQALIGISSSLTGSLMDPAKAGVVSISESLAKFAPLVFLVLLGGNPVGCIAGIVVLIGVIALAILGFLAVIQPVVLSVLVIVAPLAFIAMALPMTKSYFDKWLMLFFNWIFMLPASLIILALIDKIGQAGLSQTAEDTFNTAFKGGAADSTNFLTAMVSFGLRIALLIFAVRLPFSMGGDIAGAWGKAGKWAGSQASNRLFTGALTAQSTAGTIAKRSKQMEAIKKEMISNPGKRAKLQEKLDKLKAADKAERGLLGVRGLQARLYGGSRSIPLGSWLGQKRKVSFGLAGAVAKYHPQAVMMGYQEKEARRAAATKGLAPPFSSTFAKIAGRGAVFANDASGQENKVKWWTDQKIVTALRDLQKQYKLTDEEMRLALAESPGAFEGKASAGGFWARVSADDLAPFWALIREASRRGAMVRYSDLAHPTVTDFQANEGVLDSNNEQSLAIANLDKNILSDERLEEELERRAGGNADELARARERVARFQKKKNQSGNVMVDEAGEGAGEEPEDEPLGREVAKQLGAPSPVTVVGPVELGSQSDLAVVDTAANMTLNRMGNNLQQQASAEKVDSRTQARMMQKVGDARLSPAELGELSAGKLESGGETVKLPDRTNRAMLQFATAVTRGQVLTPASAQKFAQDNLADSLPYAGRVTELANQGKIQGQDIPAMQQRLETNLTRLIRNELSPAEFEGLRAELARVSPSPDLRSEVNPTFGKLIEVGDLVSNALAQMNKPQVIRAISAGAQPQQVQKIIVQQAATDLLRETRTGEVQRLITRYQKTPADQAPQRTAIERNVSIQVANIAREALPPESGFAKLTGTQQKEAVTTAATQAVKAGGEITVDGLTRLVDGAIKAVASRVGGSNVTPPTTPPPTPPAGGTPPTTPPQ